MDNASIIGIDISKRSFQLHGATAAGTPVLRKKLTRGTVLEFFASQPPCLVVMETCGGAHHWGREIRQLGHEVRLIAPVHVKPFVKRQKRNRPSRSRHALVIGSVSRARSMLRRCAGWCRALLDSGRKIDAHAVRCPTRRPQLSSVDQLDRAREAIPPWVFPASTGR